MHADQVAEDYRAVREELRLYNPEYCLRPHIVALNKIDMITSEQLTDLSSDIEACAAKLQVRLVALPSRCLLLPVIVTMCCYTWHLSGCKPKTSGMHIHSNCRCHLEHMCGAERKLWQDGAARGGCACERNYWPGSRSPQFCPGGHASQHQSAAFHNLGTRGVQLWPGMVIESVMV